MQKLIEKMSGIVESKLTGYKTDFYNYDIETLEAGKGLYIWIIRSTGTHLIKADDLKDSTSYAYSVYNYCYDSNVSAEKENRKKSHTFYLVNLDDKSIKQMRKIKTTREICGMLED